MDKEMVGIDDETRTIKLPCKTYAEVYQYYEERTRILMTLFSPKSVLKTDCHNESGIYPISRPLIPLLLDCDDITIVEIDRDVIKKAEPYLKHDHIIVRNEDIRNLSDKNKYNLILDFSTIDHIPEPDAYQLLEKYKEAAVPFGVVSIIVWLSNNPRQEGLQYYFSKPLFMEAFKQVFGPIEPTAEHIFTDRGDELWGFLGVVDK